MVELTRGRQPWLQSPARTSEYPVDVNEWHGAARQQRRKKPPSPSVMTDLQGLAVPGASVWLECKRPEYTHAPHNRLCTNVHSTPLSGKRTAAGESSWHGQQETTRAVPAPLYERKPAEIRSPDPCQPSARFGDSSQPHAPDLTDQPVNPPSTLNTSRERPPARWLSRPRTPRPRSDHVVGRASRHAARFLNPLYSLLAA